MCSVQDLHNLAGGFLGVGQDALLSQAFVEEVAAELCPAREELRADVALLGADVVRGVAVHVAAALKRCEEHPLPAHAVLYAQRLQQAVEAHGPHAVVLRHLRHRQRVLRAQHRVRELRLGLERGVGLFELVHAGLQPVQPLGHLVAPRAADLRQHLGGDPVLEGPRLLQLRGEDERVEAALVDDDRLLLATDGVVNHDPIPVFLIHMAVQRIAGVAVVDI